MTYQINDLIPDNYVGKPINLSYSVILSSREDALVYFNRATERLLSPSNWHKLSCWSSAHFALAVPDEEEAAHLAEEGDFFRIDLPEQGAATADGFDWITVEKINLHKNPSGTSEWSFLQVRPCTSPRQSNGEIAHFFKSLASSSYIIERNGMIVTARYHGRNETPNMPMSSILGNVESARMPAGAAIGLSELQWSAFLKGLVSAET